MKKTALSKKLLVLLLTLMMMLSISVITVSATPTYEWWDLNGYTTAIAYNSGTVAPGTAYAGVRTLTGTVDGEPMTITHYYGWIYEDPVNQKQRFNIYVPDTATANSAVFNNVNNSGWNSNAYPNTISDGFTYTTSGANPANIGLALKRNMIIINCGTVSRNDAATAGQYLGHSPGTMADTKAAMLILRANAQPGGALYGKCNPDLAFVSGTSGGGALSVVLAASGNSPDYYPYLYELGAVGVDYDGVNYTSAYSDAYMGTIAYCPITDLPMADHAYEFTYNVSRTMRASNDTVNGSLAAYGSNYVMQWSAWLANDFIRYVDLLQLKDEHGDVITASYTPPAAADPGYTGSANRDLAGAPGGSFISAMKRMLEKGLEKAITEIDTGGFTAGVGAVDALGSRAAYINVNGSPAANANYPAGSTVEITDLDAFLTNLPTQALKVAGAFHSYGATTASQWENDLLGTKSEQFSYVYEYAWDRAGDTTKGASTTSAALVPATVGLLKSGLTWNQFITSAAGKLVASEAKMTSPIPYLVGADKIPYLIDSGAVTSDVADVAPYWYVRHGTADRDTSFAVDTILYYALLNHKSVDNNFLNLNFAWNQGHGGTYDNLEAFAWLDTAIADYYATKVSISGPAAVTYEAGATAVYTVSVANAHDISAVQLTLRVDGNYFSTKSSTGLSGFASIGDIDWNDIGGGIYEGTIVLAGPGASGDIDVFQIEFNLSGLLGSTSVELIDFKIAYEGAWVNYIYADTAVDTSINQWYSIYDLNTDGVIDLRDISIAMMYYMAVPSDANWAQAQIADVNDDGVVDIDDLILIRANFT